MKCWKLRAARRLEQTARGRPKTIRNRQARSFGVTILALNRPSPTETTESHGEPRRGTQSHGAPTGKIKETNRNKYVFSSCFKVFFMNELNSFRQKTIFTVRFELFTRDFTQKYANVELCEGIA